MMEYAGILMINLKEAQHLVVADIISSDPYPTRFKITNLDFNDVLLTTGRYVVFQVGPQKVKSKVIQNTLNPVWNEVLQLCISWLDNQLQCTLYLWILPLVQLDTLI
jgi:stromal membrane-associated protein